MLDHERYSFTALPDCRQVGMQCCERIAAGGRIEGAETASVNRDDIVEP